ncbi:MAG: hypothetical protein IK028_04810 [Bacilli bacterium]|nr:hypothetical protein [Bacilli bacterium]
MAFKIYFNKKTRHPSISLSGKDKTRWENMEMTHKPSKHDSYIDIVTISKNGSSKTHVRKYIRKDKHGAKGKRYTRIGLNNESEQEIKSYLKLKHKKR